MGGVLVHDMSGSVRQLPLCNRHEFVLDRIADRDVLSVGLGGQPTAVDYSFDLTTSNLTGTFSAQVARSARSATFVDISELAIDRYRKVVEADYFLADVCAAPDSWLSDLADRRFDYVVLGEVLEHLDSPGAALRSLQTLLRPDGALLVTVPNSFSLSVFARMALGRENVHPEHVAYYSPKTLSRLLAMSGLEVTEVGFYRTRTLQLTQLRSHPLGYLSGLIAERLPQLGQGVVAVARPRSLGDRE